MIISNNRHICKKPGFVFTKQKSSETYSEHRQTSEMELFAKIQSLTIFTKSSIFTAWKVSKYGVFSDPYFTVFGLNTGIFSSNTGKCRPEKLRIWTLFTQCLDVWHGSDYAFGAGNNAQLNRRVLEDQVCILLKVCLLYQYYEKYVCCYQYH